MDNENKTAHYSAEITAENTIILPNAVKQHLNGIRADYIYILKKGYLTIYGAKYSEALAEVLRENSTEVKQVHIEDKIILSGKAMEILKLHTADTVGIELYSYGVFVKKYFL